MARWDPHFWDLEYLFLCFKVLDCHCRLLNPQIPVHLTDHLGPVDRLNACPFYRHLLSGHQNTSLSFYLTKDIHLK